MEAYASASYLLALRAPHVADDACEMGWRPIRVLVHVGIVSLGRCSDCVPAKDHAFPTTEVLFTVGIE